MEIKEFCDRYAVADRYGTNSFKWDCLEEKFGDRELLPMWVADMDFKAPECVTEALIKLSKSGLFGYSFIPQSYYDAVADWDYRHFGQRTDKSHIRVTHGVVSAIYWAVDMYTGPDDAVIILTPVYNHFADAAHINGRKLISCDLEYKNGIFAFDADKFEKCIVDNNVRLYIMCSPHNPAGRVWKEAEISAMLEICRKHRVLVVSDEIHRDLVYGDNRHIPTVMAGGGKYKDIIITLNSVSKTFNLAACLTSNAIIDNDDLREIWDKYTARYFSVEDNIFGLAACEAAMRYGEEWYEAVKKIIVYNYSIVKEAFADRNDIYVSALEGTYLAFLDFRKAIPADCLRDFIQNRCRIAANYGEAYGDNFKGFVRLNLAASPDMVQKAMNNIKRELSVIIY